MISPSDQGRIQIEITNACPGKCSNCSRFVPHVRKPFFMDMETFQRAVQSMRGYRGMLGIMGGEPTLHPQFREMVLYYRKHWAGGAIYSHGRTPIENFADYHSKYLADIQNKSCGLWTALGRGYWKHFELIQETFPYQCINTHQAGATHQPLLVTRKETDISDEEWRRRRDNCWIQRLWSASINPRGAWFCEIAAAMAMLYGDLPDCPGPKEGWPIEPGWWKRRPEEFGDQLAWCEYCAVPLGLPPRVDAEELQDVSEAHARWLEKIQSPALQNHRCVILRPSQGNLYPTDSNWYMPPEGQPVRAGGRDLALRVRRLSAITVSVDCGASLQRVLPRNRRHFDTYIVVTTPADHQTQQAAMATGATLVVTDACYWNDDAFNKARMLNAGLAKWREIVGARDDEWLCLLDADILLFDTFGERIRQLILNPGCLYYTRRWRLAPQDVEYCFGSPWGAFDAKAYLHESDHAPWGYFQLFHPAASVLQPWDEFKFPECFCSAGSVDAWFHFRWHDAKKISLSDYSSEFDVIHFDHGNLAQRWNGSRPTTGWRYAGQTDIQRPEVTWPRPCLFRRINIRTLETEVVEWRDDGPPPWTTPLCPDELYEFSIRDV